MNLNEWSKISEEDQRKLILQWSKERRRDIYEDLAWEAVRTLKKELAGLPEISLIAVGGGEILLMESPTLPICDLVINVCTLRPTGHRISQLPTHFAGFRVQQRNLGEQLDAYLRTWKRLFKELNGWSEETTLRWAEKWESSLRSCSSPIYSSGPVKAALGRLVDDRVKFLVGSDLNKLLMDIGRVISQTEKGKWPPTLHPDTVEDYDWEYVRRRIKELVDQYTVGKKEGT